MGAQKATSFRVRMRRTICSPHTCFCCRGKRSVVLDLNKPEAREALLRHRYRATSAKNGTVEDLQERWASPVYCEPL